MNLFTNCAKNIKCNTSCLMKIWNTVETIIFYTVLFLITFQIVKGLTHTEYNIIQTLDNLKQNKAYRWKSLLDERNKSTEHLEYYTRGYHFKVVNNTEHDIWLCTRRKGLGSVNESSPCGITYAKSLGVFNGYMKIRGYDLLAIRNIKNKALDFRLEREYWQFTQFWITFSLIFLAMPIISIALNCHLENKQDKKSSLFRPSIMRTFHGQVTISLLISIYLNLTDKYLDIKYLIDFVGLMKVIHDDDKFWVIQLSMIWIIAVMLPVIVAARRSYYYTKKLEGKKSWCDCSLGWPWFHGFWKNFMGVMEVTRFKDGYQGVSLVNRLQSTSIIEFFNQIESMVAINFCIGMIFTKQTEVSFMDVINIYMSLFQFIQSVVQLYNSQQKKSYRILAGLWMFVSTAGIIANTAFACFMPLYHGSNLFDKYHHVLVEAGLPVTQPAVSFMPYIKFLVGVLVVGSIVVCIEKKYMFLSTFQAFLSTPITDIGCHKGLLLSWQVVDLKHSKLRNMNMEVAPIKGKPQKEEIIKENKKYSSLKDLEGQDSNTSDQKYLTFDEEVKMLIEKKDESSSAEIILEEQCYGLAHPYKFFTRLRDQAIYVQEQIKARQEIQKSSSQKSQVAPEKLTIDIKEPETQDKEKKERLDRERKRQIGIYDFEVQEGCLGAILGKCFSDSREEKQEQQQIDDKPATPQFNNHNMQASMPEAQV